MTVLKTYSYLDLLFVCLVGLFLIFWKIFMGRHFSICTRPYVMLMLSQSFLYEAFLLSTATPDCALILSGVYDIYFRPLVKQVILMLIFFEVLVVLTFSFPFFLLLSQAIVSTFEYGYSALH